MLDIEIKQRIREHFEAHLAIRRREARIYGFAVGIVIREAEVEKFIDDLWVHLNTKKDE